MTRVGGVGDLAERHRLLRTRDEGGGAGSGYHDVRIMNQLLDNSGAQVSLSACALALEGEAWVREPQLPVAQEWVRLADEVQELAPKLTTVQGRLAIRKTLR